jgi:hypothetical protein
MGKEELIIVNLGRNLTLLVLGQRLVGINAGYYWIEKITMETMVQTTAVGLHRLKAERIVPMLNSIKRRF